jgi:hypothetical protein
MTKKAVFRLLLGIGILATLMTFSPLTTPAHAATKPQCAVAEVILHGTSAPTITCRSTKITYLSNASGVHPNDTFVNANCWSTTYLALYWNSPISASPNYVLCIGGTGLLNLNQQLETSPNFDLRDWNDQASAWWTGCSPVTFYTDINRGGASVTEPGSIQGMNSPQGNFPLGGIGNDQLSSVWLGTVPTSWC